MLTFHWQIQSRKVKMILCYRTKGCELVAEIKQLHPTQHIVILSTIETSACTTYLQRNDTETVINKDFKMLIINQSTLHGCYNQHASEMRQLKLDKNKIELLYELESKWMY